MLHEMRFGRRLSVPSTAEIKHELRLMAALDAVESAANLRPGFNSLDGTKTQAVIDVLSRDHGFSDDRARTLVERVGAATAATAGHAELSEQQTSTHRRNSAS